jgi:hypothetical protein
MLNMSTHFTTNFHRIIDVWSSACLKGDIELTNKAENIFKALKSDAPILHLCECLLSADAVNAHEHCNPPTSTCIILIIY